MRVSIARSTSAWGLGFAQNTSRCQRARICSASDRNKKCHQNEAHHVESAHWRRSKDLPEHDDSSLRKRSWKGRRPIGITQHSMYQSFNLTAKKRKQKNRPLTCQEEGREGDYAARRGKIQVETRAGRA